jgi:hypothetical protein
LVGRLVGEQKRKMDSERAEVERKILLRREYADKVKHRSILDLVRTRFIMNTIPHREFEPVLQKSG